MQLSTQDKKFLGELSEMLSTFATDNQTTNAPAQPSRDVVVAEGKAAAKAYCERRNRELRRSVEKKAA